MEQKHNKRLSIIIPVFNAGKFLKAALDSFIHHCPEASVEVLLINDGSTDNSAQIIGTYASDNPCIRIIDKQNGGVSETRNLGIEEAKGEYIFFMDADDLLHPDFFKRVMPLLENSNPDILAWKYQPFYRNPKFGLENASSEQHLFSNQASKNDGFNFLSIRGSAVSPCTKAIKKSLIRNIRFDKTMTYGEDMFFSWKIIMNASTICYIDYPLYFYRQTPGSAVSKYHARLYETYKRSFEDIRSYMDTHGLLNPVMERELGYHFALRLPALISMENRAPYSTSEKLRRLNMIIHDSLIHTALEKDTRLRGKIFGLALDGKVKELLLRNRREALKARLLYPIKKLLK